MQKKYDYNWYHDYLQEKNSLQLFLGSKNVPSVCQGPVDFLAGQVIFHGHLPRVQARYLPTKKK